MEHCTTKTEVIKFRATEEQKHKIVKKALDYGFTSVSAFILWAVLEEDHTEKGAAAMTATLQQLMDEVRETLEEIRNNVHEDQKAFSDVIKESAAKLDEWENVNAAKINEALMYAKKAKMVACTAAKAQKKDNGFFADAEWTTPVGIAMAAILVLLYLSYFYFH